MECGEDKMSDELEKSKALEALQKIKEAEEEARKIVREAQDTTSVQIIQDAQDQAQQIKENALEEARRSGQVKRATIIQKAKAEAEEITLQAEQEKSALRQKTESQLEDAVAKVAEKIQDFFTKGVL
jgi:V/A-type H+-transporting ATPase subunit G/H